jgi:ABC-type transport system involved in cytochrome c biogenesis permease subunit
MIDPIAHSDLAMAAIIVISALTGMSLAIFTIVATRFSLWLEVWQNRRRGEKARRALAEKYGQAPKGRESR